MDLSHRGGVAHQRVGAAPALRCQGSRASAVQTFRLGLENMAEASLAKKVRLAIGLSMGGPLDEPVR
jgi:hypothetical protein